MIAFSIASLIFPLTPGLSRVRGCLNKIKGYEAIIVYQLVIGKT